MIIKDTGGPLFRTEQGSHYYYPDGRPCYSVPNKSQTGQERKTTLSDARKLGLLPSVTTIQRMLDKPALNDWRCEMAVIAALTLPRNEGEDVDAFAKRIAKDADTIRDAAADTGKLIHKAIEIYCTNLIEGGGEMPDPEAITWPFMVHFNVWFRENILRVISAEEVVVKTGNNGYAGTRDLLAIHKTHGLSVIDFKTQKFKGGKPKFYDEWVVQIGAYDVAETRPAEALVSLAINSSEPMPVVEKLWSEEERAEASRIWGAMVPLWYALKGISPEK